MLECHMFAPGGITTTIRSILISIIGLVILVPKPIELILILLWNGSTTWFVMNPATRALVVIFMTARALITVISEVEAATERCSSSIPRFGYADTRFSREPCVAIR
ncbi:hypothetical protein HBI68_205750 [Parastagonospora nodorum]|nr:hypothetical protein HBI68_205750 [Parastagonospora nodorum]